MNKIWSSILHISNNARYGVSASRIVKAPESIFSPFWKARFSTNKAQIPAAEIVGEESKKPKRHGKLKITPITLPSSVEHYRMPDFKRAESYFPSVTTTIMKQGVVNKGDFKQISFKFPPKMGKTDIAAYLSQLYGLKVLKVHTVNREGKKKRIARGVTKMPDWKKAYVYVDDSENPIDFEGSRPQVTIDTKTSKEQKAQPAKTAEQKEKEKKDYNKNGAKRVK